MDDSSWFSIEKTSAQSSDVVGLLVSVVEVCGVMAVHNTVGVLVFFSLVNLTKCFEESEMDAFVAFVVGTTNSFFVVWDNMM
eukprot:13469367-Ditylum_brightwellii.AAC.1